MAAAAHPDGWLQPRHLLALGLDRRQVRRGEGLVDVLGDGVFADECKRAATSGDVEAIPGAAVQAQSDVTPPTVTACSSWIG